MNIIYKEKVPTYVFVTAILLITCIILLIILMSQLTSKPIVLDLGGKVILLIVLIFNIVVLFYFRELVIIVTESRILFGFGKFRKKFYTGNIESIEIDDYKFSNYLGYGIRYGRDKSIGYVPRGGKGLRMKFKNEKRIYFFSTDRPDELKLLLEKYIK
ncbi:hypothetical protein HQ571_01100 [Candidatus Kuenenbacteria bacterium]|nr:hypothetical protein [Candidatus Kuenenbacteria bacterium]